VPGNDRHARSRARDTAAGGQARSVRRGLNRAPHFAAADFSGLPRLRDALYTNLGKRKPLPDAGLAARMDHLKSTQAARAGNRISRWGHSLTLFRKTKPR